MDIIKLFASKLLVWAKRVKKLYVEKKENCMWLEPRVIIYLIILIGVIVLPIIYLVITLKNDCCIRIAMLNEDWSVASTDKLESYKLIPPKCLKACTSNDISQKQIDVYNFLMANNGPEVNHASDSNFVIFEVGGKPVEWHRNLLEYFKTLLKEPSKNKYQTSIRAEADSEAKELEQIPRPWRLEEINLVRRKSLVIGKFKWVLLKDKGVYHVTWEIDGGGITGHLFTRSSEVNLSFWPNTIYHIRVETTMHNKIIQSETVTVDTTKAKFTRTDVLFDADDYGFFVRKEYIYSLKIDFADCLLAAACFMGMLIVIFCILVNMPDEKPETDAVGKKCLKINDKANDVLKI